MTSEGWTSRTCISTLREARHSMALRRLAGRALRDALRDRIGCAFLLLVALYPSAKLLSGHWIAADPLGVHAAAELLGSWPFTFLVGCATLVLCRGMISDEVTRPGFATLLLRMPGPSSFYVARLTAPLVLLGLATLLGEGLLAPIVPGALGSGDLLLLWLAYLLMIADLVAVCALFSVVAPGGQNSAAVAALPILAVLFGIPANVLGPGPLRDTLNFIARTLAHVVPVARYKDLIDFARGTAPFPATGALFVLAHLVACGVIGMWAFKRRLGRGWLV